MQPGRGDQRGMVERRVEGCEGQDRTATPITDDRSGFLCDQSRGRQVPDATLGLDVRVEASDRDVAELGDRAAEDADPCAASAQRCEQGGLVDGAQPLGTDHRRIGQRGLLHPQPPPVPPRAGAVDGCEPFGARFGVDRRDQWLACREARDRHRVLRQTLREVARAVDRVDDPHELRVRPQGFGLLSEETVVRMEGAHGVAHLPLDPDVDRRDEVALALASHIAPRSIPRSGPHQLGRVRGDPTSGGEQVAEESGSKGGGADHARCILEPVAADSRTVFRFASIPCSLLAVLAASAACGGVAPRTAPPPILVANDSGADSSPARRLERITASAARDAERARSTAPAILGEIDADLATALQLAVNGDRPAAISRLRSLVRMAPHDSVPSLLLARVLVEAGEAGSALEALERLPDRAEFQTLARPWRGLARLQLGDLDAAASDLREELATGTQGALAGRALARAYAALELHGEATAVLHAACARFPADVELAFAAAELLRDRFEREAADGALRAITGRWPEFAPAHLALAELAYERGDDAGCRAALAAMPMQDLDPGTRARRGELDTALVGLVEGRPRALPARALLAAVRGGRAGERATALAALMTAGETREAAFCAACTHGDADLRVRAVRSVPPDEPRLDAYLDTVADDVDSTVRLAVADRSRELDDAAAAARLLSKVLDAEEEPAAFRRVHEALVARRGPAVDLPQDGESDPGTRKRVRSAWRQQTAKRTE